MVSLADRAKGAWNAFTSSNQDDIFAPGPSVTSFGGGISAARPEQTRLRVGTERSIIASIYARMSIDCSSIPMRHTRQDGSGRYLEDVASGLDNCLTVEANLDQAASDFRQDIVLTMFGEGVAAIVPVDTTMDPRITGGYDIKTMRVGTISRWYAKHVRVSLWNEERGVKQDITLPKASVAIVPNPLYTVMNQPNSTLQRLIRKLAMLDSVDEATSSGKLDLIVQLPYTIKTESRRTAAQQRSADIEYQLKGSKYGIAYIDGTEKIVQLNRPAENNLLGQIVELRNQLYAELGLTPEVMNGTATEAAMINYNNRTVEPVIRAITESMIRVFLSKTARTQGQTISYYRDPFKLVPMSQMADLADKFARNEVFSANELRQFMGQKPSSDPKADMLINSNNIKYGPDGSPAGAATAPDPAVDPNAPVEPPPPEEETDTSPLDDVNDAISAAFSDLGIPGGLGVNLAPPPGLGQLDPQVILDSLDELDDEIDKTFAGLEGDDEG